MKAFITCGPASEPIDAVRVVTNRSTGELGSLLADTLTRRKIEVDCFRGLGASFSPLEQTTIYPFETNDSLWRLLNSSTEAPDFIFHAAALCDFRGDQSGKLDSRAGEISLKLTPLPKLLAKFRKRFPQARIVGWKFEVEGSDDDARAKAHRQLLECESDLCVLNGPALGVGFEVFSQQGFLQAVRTKRALCDFLADWAGGEVRS